MPDVRELVQGDSSEEDSASSSEREQSAREVIVTKVGLENTTYDGIVMALSCLYDGEYRKSRGLKAVFLLFIFALVIHLVNILVQVILVFSLLVTTVKKESAPYSSDSYDHLADVTAVVRDAVAAGVPLITGNNTLWDDALYECERVKTLPCAHFVIPFVWFTKMMQEFVDAIWRCVFVFGIPNVDPQRKALISYSDGGKMIITGCTAFIKVIFFLTAAVPQFVVALVLTWTGAKYLFFADDMGTLVMKAISLAFITQVDELMFAAFGSQRFKELVKGASYPHEYATNYHMLLWGMTAIKLSLTVFVAVVFWKVLYGHVTELRESCYEYQAAFPPEGAVSVWVTFWDQMFNV